MIPSYDVNLGRMEFSERAGRVGVHHARIGVHHGGVAHRGIYRGAYVRRGLGVAVGAAAIRAAAASAYNYNYGYSPTYYGDAGYYYQQQPYGYYQQPYGYYSPYRNWRAHGFDRTFVGPFTHCFRDFCKTGFPLRG